MHGGMAVTSKDATAPIDCDPEGTLAAAVRAAMVSMLPLLSIRIASAPYPMYMSPELLLCRVTLEFLS